MNFEESCSTWIGLAIRDSMLNHNLVNAVYLAERQFHMVQTEEAKMTLAECYLAANKNHLLIELLGSPKTVRGKYLMAMALFNVNEYDKAEQFLCT
jgi:hypothetical protein